VRPAFDLAANRREAWRRHQIAQLTLKQRQDYDKIVFRQADKLREHHTHYHDNLHAMVEEQKKKIMVEKPDLALRMFPPGKMREGRALALAKGVIDRRHEAERIVIEQDHTVERDTFLEHAVMERDQAMTQAQTQTQEIQQEKSHEAIRDLFSRLAADKDREPERMAPHT
jgi:hypothetical protein